MISLKNNPKNVFFTGKGGVGKTSLSCAFAISQADRAQKVLLVSTDPASNLDETFGVELSARPLPILEAPGLWVMNINPEVAAQEYRERLVGPYRGLLPPASVKSIEEQLSGACTTEIAAFEAFAKLLGDDHLRNDFDRIVFDTAPTGHTLRLLKLPAAWEDYLTNTTGNTSCLGPLAGLQAQRHLFSSTVSALADPESTAIVLVARPDQASLKEAERTRGELSGLGVLNLHLAINGLLPMTKSRDPLAKALQAQAKQALNQMSDGLKLLPDNRFFLMGFDLLGVDALRAFSQNRQTHAVPAVVPESPQTPTPSMTFGGNPVTRGDKTNVPAKDGTLLERVPGFESLTDLIDDLSHQSSGVIMTMGKGGVGKTSIATAIAVELAKRGHAVLLTTTDPAAHTDKSLQGTVPGLKVGHIDPESETRLHQAEVLQQAGASLDQKGRDLLLEDLRSPCTEEIAVFKAFSRIIDQGRQGFVILDTAPTGHTLLLLDAAEAYHREVTRTAQQVPEAVRLLRDRLRDPDFTKVLIVTLPEATPVHEAAYLQNDLKRAGIFPYAWVMNQSLTACQVTDPFLKNKQAREARYLHEVRQTLAEKVALVPWNPAETAITTHIQPEENFKQNSSIPA